MSVPNQNLRIAFSNYGNVRVRWPFSSFSAHPSRGCAAPQAMAMRAVLLASLVVACALAIPLRTGQTDTALDDYIALADPEYTYVDTGHRIKGQHIFQDVG